MAYQGDWVEDSIHYFTFFTRTAAGVPITLAAGSLLVYKDDDTAQSTAGLTLTTDFDGVTGQHMVKVDTSADAFYATGKDYSIQIAAGTVDSVSVVGAPVGSFSIQNRYRDVNATQLAGQTITAAAGVTFPTSVASPTNITAGTITTVTTAGLSAAAVDAIWDEVLTKATHDVINSAGRRLRHITSVIITDGTAQGPGTGTNQIQLEAGTASAVNGAYDPAMVVIIAGTGAGQSRLIYQYDGASKTCTVDRDWKTAPDNSSEYLIIGDAGREHVNEGLIRAATASTAQLNANASAEDNAYVDQAIFVRSGTGADQVRHIEAYDGASQTITQMDRDWDVTPDTTSAYVMLPTISHSTTEIAAALDAAGFLKAIVPAQNDVDVSALGAVKTQDAGPGAITYTDTITDGTDPLGDVDVWATTDVAGTNVVAQDRTTAFGVFAFYLDAGDYYLWCQKTGYEFTNPQLITVV